MLTDAEIGIDPITGQPRNKETSLLELAIILVRNRKRVLLITLAGAALGLILALVLPNRYTAKTSILPPQQSSSSAGAAVLAQMSQLGGLSSLAGSSPLGLKNPNDLQVAILRSQTVEDAMIDRFHLIQLYKVKYRAYAAKKLEKNVDIDSGSKDGVIRISVTDSDPHRAAEMANEYVDEFRKFSATLAVTEASRRRVFFEQQLAQAKDNLANAEEDMKRTEQQTGIIEVQSQARTAIESVARLRAEIAAKEVQISSLRTFANSQNPRLERAEQELASLRNEQQELGSSSNESLSGLLIPKGIMQEASLKYIRKMRDVKYYQVIFDLLARQYEAAKLDEAREGAGVQVIDRATVPELRSSPKIILIVIAGAILGMFLSIVWAFAREGMQRLSQNPEEQSRLETLRILLSSSKKSRV
jgi:tyrosine-protein kinase Etk/Wzc